MCRAKIHLKYLRSVQYTDNDEVLTKMYRSQMNLTENIKSEAFFQTDFLYWKNVSVYFSNVELKSTEILLTEEKPDYTTSQMLRFESL